MPKYRQKYGQFIVEGRKAVSELIHSDYRIHTILATEAYAAKHQIDAPFITIGEGEMKRISSFSTPPGVIALADTKDFVNEQLDFQAPLTICLDGISDPGNLGTIIRTADWFGINQVILSPDCTDFYNPKCLSATMGSFTRCRFFYADLPTFLAGKNSAGCFLEGIDVAEMELKTPLFLVVGSESHGISQQVESVINQKITIPGYGKAESLNAGIAAGIVMENLARRAFGKR